MNLRKFADIERLAGYSFGKSGLHGDPLLLGIEQEHVGVSEPVRVLGTVVRIHYLDNNK